MKRKIVSLLFGILLLMNVSYAEKIGIEEDVRAYLIADYETGNILKEYNSDEIVEIASITKLMTYLVTMDEIEKGKISLTDRVIMDEESIRVGGSTLKINLHESFTVDELLDMALIVSANNGTHRLARHVAGTEENFVRMMNKKASEIGLKSAIFYNSTGLPIRGMDVQNRMKVTDVQNMSKYIIDKYPEVLERTSKPFLLDSEGEIVKNTNPTLGIIPGVDGLKTGYTNKAGYCLVSTLLKEEKDQESDFRMIGIIMGTKGELERKELSDKFMSYAINNYSSKKILDMDDKLESIEDNNLKDRKMDIYPEKDFTKIISKEDQISIETVLSEKIKYPIKPGNRIGEVRVIENGETVFETGITVAEKIKRANFLERLFRSLVSKFLS